MTIEDYCLLTGKSRGKKCTVYDSLGNIYSGIYIGETHNVSHNELALSLRIDSKTEDKLKYSGIEKNKNGVFEITILISCITKLIFE
ncbi:MAG: hypothetical protein IKZ37_07265 [Bacteroidaceae bacterium]|nr:hypothetical protein [Bacteroidaceae bacterium]